MRLTFRQLLMMTIATLFTNSFLIVIFLGVSGGFFVAVVSSDPALVKQVEAINKTFQDSGSDFQQTDTEAQRSFDAYSPILTRLSWLPIAVVSSVIAFSVLGFFLARWVGSLDWQGGLPLLAIVSGTSPPVMCNYFAERGVASAALPAGQQVLVFLVQMLVVYAAGALGLRRRKRVAAAVPIEAAEVI